MKKIISLIIGISLLFTSTLSFASSKVEPQSEPGGYIVVYSESKTKVVTQQDEANCNIANWAFLTTYTMGASIVLSGVTGFAGLFGLETLHKGEVVTTHTSITFDKYGNKFDYVQRTVVKSNSKLVSDYTFIESYGSSTKMYGVWKVEFKNKLVRGYMISKL